MFTQNGFPPQVVIAAALNLPPPAGCANKYRELCLYLLSQTQVLNDNNHLPLHNDEIPYVVMFGLLERYPDILNTAKEGAAKGHRSDKLVNFILKKYSQFAQGWSMQPFGPELQDFLQKPGICPAMRKEIRDIRKRREENQGQAADILPARNLFGSHAGHVPGKPQTLIPAGVTRPSNLDDSDIAQLPDFIEWPAGYQLQLYILSLAKIIGSTLTPDKFREAPSQVQPGGDRHRILRIAAGEEACQSLLLLLEEADLRKYITLGTSASGTINSLFIDLTAIEGNFVAAMGLGDYWKKALERDEGANRTRRGA